MQSSTEENYLKVIHHFSSGTNTRVLTNQLAEYFNSTPSSVTDMLARLSGKKLVNYKKYYGVLLSEKGKKLAVDIIRRHRLWEVFLAKKLGFAWDEVHPIAEEMEHVSSNALIERLDKFLDYPKIDPHGDPIPDKNGNYKPVVLQPLSELKEGDKAIISKVIASDATLLSYLKEHLLIPGSEIKLLALYSFDGSVDLMINNKKKIHISKDVAQKIVVK
ncbi:MAG TPA: metal-dependent transcriptional regulator [Bacteroidia bacterium]|nr:metal-dependent transcriptional regulator [Bacteroidia bacterium]HNU32767.1 metal-dependent transcriptional regulator [Bacteroidia bacterium]